MADIANLVIRIDTTDIRRAKTELTSLATLSTRVDKNFDRLAATSRNSFGAVSNSADGATNSFNRSNTAAANLFKTITRFTVIYYLSHRLADVTISLARAAEEFELLDKKLLNVTKDVTAFGQTFAMAQKVGVEMKTAAAGITRFAVATRNAFDVKQMLGWQEGLIKSARLVGTTQKEIQSGMIQITQAMSAGRLQGDEFRSVMENLPMLAVELRKSFQGSTISLKELASQGKITNEVLIAAMERLNEKMKDVPGLTNTIDAEFAKLENSWKRLLHNMTEGTDSWLKQTVRGLDWLVKKLGNVPINLARMEKEANTARLKEIEAELAKLFTSLQKQVAKDDLLGQIVVKSQMNALLEEQKELTEYFRKQNELKKAQAEYEKELKGIREEQEKNKQFTEEQKVLEALRAQVVILDEREKLTAEYQARLKTILATEAKTAEAKALQTRAIETQTAAYTQNMKKLGATGKSGGSELSFIDALKQEVVKAEKDFGAFEDRIYSITSLMMDASPVAFAVYQEALEKLTGSTTETAGKPAPKSGFEKFVDGLREAKKEAEQFKIALNNAFSSGAITPDEYAEGMKKLASMTGEATNKVQELNEYQKMAARGFRNFSDGIVDSMFKANQSFSEFARNFLLEMTKMIAKQMLFNAMKSGANALGIGGLFGFADGGVFDKGVQKFATGGIVNSPTIFPMANGTGLMGEAGPEAIMPLTRGKGGKLGVRAEGGGTVINQTINVSGAGDKQLAQALAMTAKKATNDALSAVYTDFTRNGTLRGALA